MQNDKKNSEPKKVIKTIADANLALNILLRKADRQNLENGIYTFLHKLKNPHVNDLFNRYPDLLQEYGLKEMLTGKIEIHGAIASEIKTAVLLSCLQVILLFCADLKAHQDTDEQQRKMLQYFLKSMACDKFVGEMFLMVTDLVGADYYAVFRKKIDGLDVGPEQMHSLENDPELQEHLDLMTWFCLVRVFLESVYVVYDTDK